MVCAAALRVRAHALAENVAADDDFNPVHVRSAARNVRVCLATDALADDVWHNKLMSIEHAASLPPRIEPDCAHRVFLVGARADAPPASLLCRCMQKERV